MNLVIFFFKLYFVLIFLWFWSLIILVLSEMSWLLVIAESEFRVILDFKVVLGNEIGILNSFIFVFMSIFLLLILLML